MRRSLRLIATLSAVLVLGLGFSSSAQAQVVEGEEHCVVNVKTSDRLNVRQKPSASANIVTKLRYGECGITVTGACQGHWCPVEDGHFAGWVNGKFVSMVSPALYCVSGVGAGEALNLQAFPSSQSKILKLLSRHQCDIAFLPYATDNWQKIRVVGFEGWVNRKYVSGE